MGLELLVGLGVLGFLAFVAVLVPMMWRRIVPTNEVHILQTNKETISYGKDSGNGNTYYEVPSWIPKLGVSRIKLDVSIFDINLTKYEAFDKGRLPFLVNVTSFFRITDSNQAAKSVSSEEDFKKQLKSIVEGSVRSVLAAYDIETIMADRSVFGEHFTKEVSEQLKNWGISAVKNIELMNIEDAPGSNVIANIMEKKKSQIDMESRTTVAGNKQKAQEAEIEATRKVQVKQQEANQEVGLKTIASKQSVALSQQEMDQKVKEKEKETKEKEMNVLQVEYVRTAEINKAATIVKSEQEKATAILQAEAKFEVQKRQAEGELVLKLKESEGITAEGTARAEAEKAMQLAPVSAQITLAKEIGGNEAYQTYLLSVRKIEATQAVGIEQAKALGAADIKIINSNGGGGAGLGTQFGAMLEGLANTETGKAVINTLTGNSNTVQ